MSEVTLFDRLTSRLSVAARGLLGWSQAKLSEESGVARKTISDFEAGSREPFARTKRDLVEAFQKNGVLFEKKENGSIAISTIVDDT
jgi:transcriptional regulator with XRE-family HTH domain